jgi:hypothetical protein
MRVDRVIRVSFLFLVFFFFFKKELGFKSRFRFAGGLHLPGVFGFDEGFQVIQAGGPEDAVLLDPGVDGAQRFGIEFVDAVAAFAVFANQVSAAQEAQVLGDGWTRDRESFGNLSGGLAAAAQKVKDGAAGRVGKGLERGFGLLGAGICNRSVPHNA